MPELPEVEIVRRGLAERLLGDKITRVHIRVPRIFVGESKFITNTPVICVRRIAKALVIDFEGGYSLIVHLKMTGQLVYQKKGDITVGGHPEKVYEQPLPHKHTHIIYYFSDDAVLYYNDLRKFGWNKIVLTSLVLETLGKGLSGVDILSPTFSFAYFESFLIRRANRPLKVALMEQQYIAGIGNIYACEALWQAKVHPERTAKSLKPQERKRLYKAIKYVIDLSLQNGGTSFNSFVNAQGERGSFLKFAQVYKQEKDSKGHVVFRIKQSGRTTHFCPVCQV